jgi:hypothetical protein
MTIPRFTSHRATAQRLDRRNRGVTVVLNAMRHGSALHKMFTPSGTVWTLTNGCRVNSSVAAVVIVNPNIVSVGDGLFGDASTQTYRFISD